MKYVQINAYSGAWAESIVFAKHKKLISEGNESWVFWARGNHKQDKYMKKIAYFPEICVDVLKTRFLGNPGFHSIRITKRLLRQLDQINPDIVHLHVLLGYYINVDLLFKWLAEHECQVVWTLHDCWAFTGHCIYFTYAGCEQWESGCGLYSECPLWNSYPETFKKNQVYNNYLKKKEIFTRIPRERMKLIAPSMWMADLVKRSFLCKYDVEVIHNSADKNTFKPTESTFKKLCKIEDKYMILGIASKWSERKGLSEYVRLMDDLHNYNVAIVIVGINNRQIRDIKRFLFSKFDVHSQLLVGNSLFDKFHAEILSVDNNEKIIFCKKTENKVQLAALYTAADVFFNPTKEDNYPTVNLESELCKTPVITYNTGGCAETISMKQSLTVVDYAAAIQEITRRMNSN